MKLKLPENFVVIDVETSGLDAKGGILEIGAVKANGDMFYERVALERGRVVHQGALDCNGIDPVDLGKGGELIVAMMNFANFLEAGTNDRWIMGGKNPQFDYGFLKEAWPVGEIGVPIGEVISRRCVDLHSLMYGMGLSNDIDMAAEGFSTDDLYAEFLNIGPEPKPHNAIRGALHEYVCFCVWLRGRPLGDVERAYFEEVMQAMDRDNLPGKIDSQCFDFAKMRIGIK